MNWRDLLDDTQTRVLPWVSGRVLCANGRTWTIKDAPPQAVGWARFQLEGRTARYLGPAEPGSYDVGTVLCIDRWGFLAGDRLIPESARVTDDLLTAARAWPRVYLLDGYLPRFQRVAAGQTARNEPWVYAGPAWPLGPESEVQQAYEDGATTLDGIKHVTPDLNVAFHFARQLDAFRQRQAVARAEALRRREAERQAAQLTGTAYGRRELAQRDFKAAATAALALSGAEYLDHRQTQPDEYVVRFRWLDRRFECVVDDKLQVVDSGVCLTAEYRDQDFTRGTRGDTWFTLESLPGVLQQADREDRLVVYRH